MSWYTPLINNQESVALSNRILRFVATVLHTKLQPNGPIVPSLAVASLPRDCFNLPSSRKSGNALLTPVVAFQHSLKELAGLAGMPTMVRRNSALV
jgi:hypothetical protein